MGDTTISTQQSAIPRALDTQGAASQPARSSVSGSPQYVSPDLVEASRARAPAAPASAGASGALSSPTSTTRPGGPGTTRPSAPTTLGNFRPTGNVIADAIAIHSQVEIAQQQTFWQSPAGRAVATFLDSIGLGARPGSLAAEAQAQKP